MATRRMLAASISVSEQVAALRDDFTRLLFTWMIAHADDWGVMPGSAPRVRAIVVPMLDCTNAQVDAALDDMAAHDLIWRYAAPDGTKLVQFRTWEEHQQGLHKRTAPKLLRYCDMVPGTSGKVSELPVLARARGTELNGTELNGREREGAHAREDGAAAPVSLSLVEKPSDPEPEPEPPAPVDPQAERSTEQALYDAWCAAVDYTPKSSERRSWIRALNDLQRNYGLDPPGVPALVAQYRAKLGSDRKPTPGQVLGIYSQLGVSPHVTAYATNGHAPAHRKTAADSADYARRKRAALAQLGVALPALPPASTGTDTSTAQ